jgi:3-deoxy-7-phosphoheptulonate synthase
MDGLPLIALTDPNQRTIVRVGSVSIGTGFVVIAGPCSVESEGQIIETAIAAKKSGADLLRGGAFKPRTSPYSFQGLGEKGLKYLCMARELTGLPIVSEVMDTRDVELVSDHVDVLQIGSRNMQNFSLLAEVGKGKKPVMLKRGMNATLDEWLHAAEYILAGGNRNVILCERGIRTHERYTRNTLDLSAVPALRELTHLPVLVDPSHGTGLARLVEPMALAAYVSGASGIMVEMHRKPDEAMSDKEQTLSPQQFTQLMEKLKRLESVWHPHEATLEKPEASTPKEHIRVKRGAARIAH